MLSKAWSMRAEVCFAFLETTNLFQKKIWWFDFFHGIVTIYNQISVKEDLNTTSY